MAQAAILRDGFLVGRQVRFVVAAEAARIVGVAEIVRVGSPGDLEIREHVALVDRGQGLLRPLEFREPCLAAASGYFCR